MTPLTAHFALEEFTASETADLRGIDNMPGPDGLAHLTRLAQAMEAVRALFGRSIHITSGYRSPALNHAVGGVANSDHALGWACDFHVAGLSDVAVARVIRDSGFGFDQLIWEPGRCVHFSVNPRMRRQVLTQPGGPGTPVNLGIGI